MLPIKIINRSANKYQLPKHNVTDTNKVKRLVVHLPPKTRKFTPRGTFTSISSAVLKMPSHPLTTSLFYITMKLLHF